jgi:HK97 family phage major capsid protein
MNEEERKQLIEAVKQALAEKLKAAGITDEKLIAGLKGRLDAIEQMVADNGGIAPSIRSMAPGSIASALAADAFKNRLNLVKEGQPTTGKIHLPNVGIKTLVNFPDGGSPSSGWQTPAQRGPIVGPVQRPLTMLDVLPVINVLSNQYEYIRVSHVNSAGVQGAEGDQKPEGNVYPTLVTTKIATVAEWMRASRQVLSDNVQLTTFLTNLLAYDVRQKAEALILNGDETDPEGFDGLITAAPVLATTETLAPDIISQGLTFLTNLGYQPGFVALHPLDFHRLRTLKASGGSEEYMVGSWANPSAPNVWNTPIVQSPALTEGEALIVDPSKVAVLDRQEVQVAVSTEDRDNLIKNLVTLIAEARFGLAIFDDAAIGKVNLPVPSP